MNNAIKYSIAMLLLTACGGNRQLVKSSKGFNNQDSEQIELNTLVHHHNDSLSTVYFEIGNENILYKLSDTGTAFYSNLRVFYALTDEQDDRKMKDSASFYINDRSESEYVKNKILYAQLNLKAKLGNSYDLATEALDLHRKTRYESGMHVDKKDRFSAQNFLLRVNDTIAFKNTFRRGQKVNVEYAHQSNGEVFVNAYLKEFGPAAPPFSAKPPEENKFTPDSSFTVRYHDKSFSLQMPQKGFYHVRANNITQQGVSVFTTGENFPGVNSSEEMINCTRYIMNREEFDACKNADDKKAAIDKFWLGVGGSNERARELLRRYYGRVKDANKRFTSYKEGWKTDRGLIFIVFGAPTNVYRTPNDDIWVYGNEANSTALRFVFNKAEEPFSENDYVLERSVFYREAYYQAVDYWRQGNVFLERDK